GEERTVLDTGLVPQWIRGPDGGLYDVSGLGAITAQWFSGLRVAPQLNIVRRPDGSVVSPARYKEQILEGFRLAAAVVTSSTTEPLGASGLIIRFSGQPVRVILRHSLNYRVALAGLERKPGGPLLCPVEDERLLKAITSIEDQALRRGD